MKALLFLRDDQRGEPKRVHLENVRHVFYGCGSVTFVFGVDKGEDMTFSTYDLQAFEVYQ